MALFDLQWRERLDPAVAEAMAEVDAAMQDGDRKYGHNAWKGGSQTSTDHLRGIERHMKRRMDDNQKYDGDSKRRALAHVAARAILALQCEIDEDRQKHLAAFTRGNS